MPPLRDDLGDEPITFLILTCAMFYALGPKPDELREHVVQTPYGPRLALQSREVHRDRHGMWQASPWRVEKYLAPKRNFMARPYFRYVRGRELGKRYPIRYYSKKKF
jgi:hypothetical protein